MRMREIHTDNKNKEKDRKFERQRDRLKVIQKVRNKRKKEKD